MAYGFFWSESASHRVWIYLGNLLPPDHFVTAPRNATYEVDSSHVGNTELVQVQCEHPGNKEGRSAAQELQLPQFDNVVCRQS
jgi:predicted Fe-Mo cluster-binding NifX family protein